MRELGAMPARSVPAECAEDEPQRFHPRPLEESVWQRWLGPADGPVVRVFGPRGVGKTALLARAVRHLLDAGVSMERIAWRRCDHPAALEASLFEWLDGRRARRDATPEQPGYIVLDEFAHDSDAQALFERVERAELPLRVLASSSFDGTDCEAFDAARDEWLGPRSADELLALENEPRPMPVCASVAATLASLSRMARPDERAALRARARLLISGGLPEVLTRTLDAERVHSANVRLARLERRLASEVIERALHLDAAWLSKRDAPFEVRRLRHVLIECALRAGERIDAREVAQRLECTPTALASDLGRLENLGLVFVTRSHGKARGVEFAAHFFDRVVRRAVLQRRGQRRTSDAGREREVDRLFNAHLAALARASGAAVGHRPGGGGALLMILDDGSTPVALLPCRDGSGPRRGLRAAIERDARLAGNAYLIPRDPLPLPAPAGEDGIGILPMDLALVALGALRDARGWRAPQGQR